MQTETDYEQHHRYFNHHNGGVETRTLPDTYGQDRSDDESDQEGGKIEADFCSENVRRANQIVRPLHELRRMGRQDLHGLIKERLRSRNQRGIGGLGHLASNDFLRLG